MIQNKKYFVYFITRPWNNLIAYIGKGKDNRQYKHGCLDKNRHLANNFKKAKRLNMEMKIEIVAYFDTEQEAHNFEIEWIAKIGRADLKKGPLCNKTDGGEGISGYQHTDKTKEYFRKLYRGRFVSQETIEKRIKSRKGYKHSNETKIKLKRARNKRITTEITKAKMSIAQKNRRLREMGWPELY